MKISAKLSIGFGLVMLLSVVLGGIGLKQSIVFSNDYETLYRDNVQAATYLSNAQNALWQLRYGFPQFMVGDEAARAKIVADEPKFYKIIEENLGKFEKGSLSDEEKKVYSELKDIYTKYTQARPKWFELYGAGKIEEAAAWRAQTTTPFGAGTVKGFTALIELNQKLGEARTKQALEDANNSKTMLAVALVLALIIGAAASIISATSITRPIKRTLEAMKDISEGDGDLTRRVACSSNDEIGQLASCFNNFAEKLGNIIRQVAGNAAQVATSADGLYQTAGQMANGAEQVASQISSMATAGEEMAATSSSIADQCNRAAGISRTASEMAVSGSQVVQATVNGMERIAKRVKESAATVASLGSRSDQIGAIIGTIEDIADQTNLLALNAAIEAARAGEQGRGFAVVADEVRALAERTTRATREIGEMIKAIQAETKGAVSSMEDGVREVEKGTGEAARSGEALQAILQQIDDVTNQINQIACAAQEQNDTTRDISNNVHQITDVVQRTAQGAHQSAASANQVARLAEEQQRLVGQFKL